MKMKSKLFGLGAKLALAILAVGTTLTGCYDSENGDVTKPYVAPDAVYSIVGTVSTTDGKAIGNTTVTLSGVLEGAVTTDANGSYSIYVTKNGGVTGEVKVAIEGKANEYEAASAITNVQKIANGQAVTYYLNIVAKSLAAEPEPDPEMVWDNYSSVSSDEYTLQGEDKNKVDYVPALDLNNKSNNPYEVTHNFVVKNGIIVTKGFDIMGLEAPKTKAAMTPEDVKAAIKVKIEKEIGTAYDTEYKGVRYPFTITLPGMTALKNVVATYTYENKTYNCTYDGADYTVEIQRVVSVKMSYNYIYTDNYHGHGNGHGHGHGDDINAGGGIIGAE